MINRRFDDRASCSARKSPEQALARKPPIHSPASGKDGHESGLLAKLRLHRCRQQAAHHHGNGQNAKHLVPEFSYESL
jgi:hypothetical protein